MSITFLWTGIIALIGWQSVRVLMRFFYLIYILLSGLTMRLTLFASFIVIPLLLQSGHISRQYIVWLPNVYLKWLIHLSTLVIVMIDGYISLWSACKTRGRQPSAHPKVNTNVSTPKMKNNDHKKLANDNQTRHRYMKSVAGTQQSTIHNHSVVQ